MKVVINRCFGGFGLSLKGQKRLGDLLGENIYFYKQTKYSFQDEIDEYQKVVDLNDDNIFIHAVTKDFGETTKGENLNEYYFKIWNLERNDSKLIQVIEELGEEANGRCSRLKVVEIPDGIDYEISDYDGMERIEECHMSWD